MDLHPVDLSDAEEAKLRGHDLHVHAHRDVMGYMYGGRDLDRGPHPLLAKLEKAIDSLRHTVPKTTDAALNIEYRLKLFETELYKIKHGQDLLDGVDSAKKKVEELELEYVVDPFQDLPPANFIGPRDGSCWIPLYEVMEKASAFYEDEWPLVPEELKRRYSGFMAGNAKRELPKKKNTPVVVNNILTRGTCLGEWTPGAEAHYGGFRTSTEGDTETRFAMEVAAETSKWEDEAQSHISRADWTLGYVQDSFRKFDKTCKRHQNDELLMAIAENNNFTEDQLDVVRGEIKHERIEIGKYRREMYISDLSEEDVTAQAEEARSLSDELIAKVLEPEQFNAYLNWRNKRSHQVVNPFANWQDLYQHLHEKVYAHLYGQRTFGHCGEVKEMVWSDGTIAYDTSDQTHTAFGERIVGGRSFYFYEHRPLQRHYLDQVWKDLSFQAYGRDFKKIQAELGQESLKYNDDHFDI
jgi:hypothetical protein